MEEKYLTGTRTVAETSVRSVPFRSTSWRGRWRPVGPVLVASTQTKRLLNEAGPEGGAPVESETHRNFSLAAGAGSHDRHRDSNTPPDPSASHAAHIPICTIIYIHDRRNPRVLRVEGRGEEPKTGGNGEVVGSIPAVLR